MGELGVFLSEREMAEGEGFEPPVPLRVRLISSQVPSTTQPPFQPLIIKDFVGRR